MSTQNNIGRTSASVAKALKAAGVIATGVASLDNDIAGFIAGVKSSESAAGSAMKYISHAYNTGEWADLVDADGKHYSSWTGFYNAVVAPSGIPVRTATLYIRANTVLTHAIPEGATDRASSGWNRLMMAGTPSVVKNLAGLFKESKDGVEITDPELYNKVGELLDAADSMTARNVEDVSRKAKQELGRVGKGGKPKTKDETAPVKASAKKTLDEHVNAGNVLNIKQFPVAADIVKMMNGDMMEYAIKMDVDNARAFCGAVYRALNDVGKLPSGAVLPETVEVLAAMASMITDLARGYESEG